MTIEQAAKSRKYTRLGIVVREDVVLMEGFPEVLDKLSSSILSQDIEECDAAVFHACWRGKQDSDFDLLVIEVGQQGCSSHDLSSTLGVSDVAELGVAGLLKDEVDNLGGVFGSHLFPREVPVCLLGFVESNVTFTPSVSSIVSEPDIISGIGNYKGRSDLGIVVYILHHVAL